MEERMIDDEELRKVKLKKTKDGETDAVEDDGTDEEYVFDTPEGEYDESLVGLTPSQLEKVLEERKKAEEEARGEFANLIASGEAALKENNYEEAEKYFAQADRYVFEDERLPLGLWTARTRGFTEKEPFYKVEQAEAFAKCNAELKAKAREAFGAEFEKERSEAIEEEKELAPHVEEARAARAEAFADNQKYYFIRFVALAAALLFSVIGAALSANFIVRTQSIAPVVCTGVFGVLVVVFLVFSLVFLRSLVVANMLCRKNREEEATEDGARLKALREKIHCLNCVLDD
ncbi:MAG: hypothetical protein K2N74_01955 [Clostridiales bacterium]|nr:hypothetical protein [Clostridiales bacterium]